jgi:hypothetical protein
LIKIQKSTIVNAIGIGQFFAASSGMEIETGWKIEKKKYFSEIKKCNVVILSKM